MVTIARFERAVVGCFVVLGLLGACTGPGDGVTNVQRHPLATPQRTSLADGSKAADLSALLGDGERPVIGVTLIDSDDPLAEACVREATVNRADVSYVNGFLGPLGASVAFEVGDGKRRLLTCDALFDSDGTRRICSITFAPWVNDVELAASGGGLSMLCQHDYPLVTAFVSVRVPPGTAWMVHHDGAGRVAYPAAGGPPVRVAGIADMSASSDTYETRVAFLDAAGRRVEASRVIGFVAG